MANNKKSVLLYCDIIHTVEELDNEDAGLLFKHYLRYINDLNPEPPSKLIKIVFEPIKQNLKRDLKKWEDKSIKNREIANMRWQKENANASERIKPYANHADKDTVTDKVIVKDTVKVKVKLNKIEVKDSVFLTEEEIVKAGEYFGDMYDKALETLSNYKMASGKKYKSDYHALLGWVSKELKKSIPESKIKNW